MVFRTWGDESQNTYNVVYTGLIGLVLLKVIPFGVLAFKKTRFDKDAARKFVLWMKASYIGFALALLLWLISGIIACALVFQFTPEDWIDNYESILKPARAFKQIGYLGQLFNVISAAATMAMLVELGPGIHRAVDGTSNYNDNFFRYCGYILTVVVVGLAIIEYSFWIAFYRAILSASITDTDKAWDLAREATRIHAAGSTILFVAALGVTALAFGTFKKRKASRLKTASILYLVCGLLNLLGSTWNFAIALKWEFKGDLDLDAQENYLMILMILFVWWSRSIILLLAFIMASKSGVNGGIWTKKKSQEPEPPPPCSRVIYC